MSELDAVLAYFDDDVACIRSWEQRHNALANGNIYRLFQVRIDYREMLFIIVTDGDVIYLKFVLMASEPRVALRMPTIDKSDVGYAIVESGSYDFNDEIQLCVPNSLTKAKETVRRYVDEFRQVLDKYHVQDPRHKLPGSEY